MSKRFDRIFVVTGSGISAESGIPTFRGTDGYWRKLNPTKLATATAFQADPALVWDWYRERRAMIRRSQPNAAHTTLVKLAAESQSFLLLTQNVDDLHLRAQWQGRALTAPDLVQIHGDIFVTRCFRCDFARRETLEDAHGVPPCPRCGSPLRPGVIWFDEELRASDVQRVEAFQAKGPSDLVLVVGTSATFDYIIDWTRQAKGRHGRILEINPEPTPISEMADEVIREPAAIALPRLFG